MSLRKRCSRHEPAALRHGEPNPLHCAASPRCEHHWFYDFRVNGRRYRNTTETADKQQEKNIEARERGRILDGRHGIRRQPDITFKAFADTYLRDHAALHKRSVDRDREIITVLNRSFGPLILHELTAHRIEQFKREPCRGSGAATRRPARRSPSSRPREPRARHAEVHPVEGGRVGEVDGVAGQGREAPEGG